VGSIFSHKPTSLSNNSRDLHRTPVPDGDERARDIIAGELKRNGHEINCYVPDSVQGGSYGTRPLPSGGTVSAQTRQRSSR
jgi:hypothetical protein